MTRPLRRLIALLSAMLPLLSAAGDAFGAHACPHHGAIAMPGHAAAMAEMVMADGGWEAHQAHMAEMAHTAAMAGMDHADHTAPASGGEHDGHETCTCGNVCPISVGPAPIAAAVLFDLPYELPYAAPAAHPDPTGLPSRLTPYLLPFAQAPPQSA